MKQPFDIPPDRNFLQHFLTGWRVKSLSPEMVEKLKANRISSKSTSMTA